MKRILFSLMILAIYASANTCTEAWFEINAYNYIYTKDHAHLDSAYYNDESTEKYIYNKEHLDYLIAKEGGEIHTINFYWNSDESVLSKKGTEYFGIIKYSEDTLFITLTNYHDGVVHEQQTAKITNKTLDAQYPDGPNGETAFEKIYFQNDSLVKSITYNYGTDSAEVHKTIIVSDEQDDFKCKEYGEKEIKNFSLEYVKNDNGYAIKRHNEKYSREYFMIYPTGTTAIRKQRPAVKISPKARYFDLLGRYKFTK